ncbi:MAG: hypothetical protein OHK0019_22260 [Saprospiraceae bacterium]
MALQVPVRFIRTYTTHPSVPSPAPLVRADKCRTVTAAFTGTPPFSLTYTTPFGAFTQSFGGITGTFQVCAPAGAPPGALTVQATSLTDSWCGCP